MSMQPVASQGDGERIVSNKQDPQLSTDEEDGVEGSGSGSSSGDESDETDEDDDDHIGPMLSERGENDYSLGEADLEAGIQPRGQQAKVRDSASMHPRSSSQRRRSNLRKRMMGNFRSDKEIKIVYPNRRPGASDGQGRLMVQDMEQGRQYRLTSIRPRVRLGTRIKNWLGFGMGTMNSDTRQRSGVGIVVNEALMRYLRWTNRSSFAAVILSAAVGFLGLTTGFAFLIWRMGHRHPECIGGVDLDKNYFADAFALSWTTFSTVGYGAVYSGISTEKPEIVECTGITILLSIEAFLGVLFASFCSAVVIEKVNRIQSFAQVRFSDPIVIRYGSGVVQLGHDQDGNAKEGNETRRIPCPVLEFRIANRMESIAGGEILDATVSLVASIPESQTPSQVFNEGRRRPHDKKSRHRGQRVMRQGLLRRRSGSKSDVSSETESSHTDKTTDPNEKAWLDRARQRPLRTMNANARIPLLASAPAFESFQEDRTGHLAHKRIFAKLEVESAEHPFFKRAWIVRHTLNRYSPLLLPSVREEVKANGGYWPANLNSAASVRASIRFGQMLVNFSGTSNADGNSVYAQKGYEFVDLNVGYRFVNMLYRDRDSNLRADIELLNDVVEQAGGGGEFMASVSHQLGSYSMDDMLVL